MPEKILILTYYFPPSGGSGVQRWMYFSKYLPEFGFEPVVVTVDPAYASYKFIDKALEEKVKNIRTIRTRTREPLRVYSKIRGGDVRQNIPQGFAGESDPGIFQKLARFVRGNFFLPDARRGWNKFAFDASAELIRNENIKLVITTGPPHSTHFIGKKLKRNFGIKWIADFRDPWTEVYYNRMLYRTNWASGRDKAMESGVLKEADRILTIGPGMKKLLQGKLPEDQKSKVHYIYNGFDEELIRGLEKKKDPEHFTICHTGILSENQPITSFVKALSLLAERNPDAIKGIRMLFVGKVSPSMVSELKGVLNEDQVISTGYLSNREALQYTLNADLLLNSFAVSDDSSLLVSGKLMDYLATGNPVIGLGDPAGDAARLLKDIPQARIFDRKDVKDISVFIENIYFHWLNGESFPSIDVSPYSRRSTTKQLADWLQELI